MGVLMLNCFPQRLLGLGSLRPSLFIGEVGLPRGLGEAWCVPSTFSAYLALHGCWTLVGLWRPVQNEIDKAPGPQAAFLGGWGGDL